MWRVVGTAWVSDLRPALKLTFCRLGLLIQVYKLHNECIARECETLRANFYFSEPDLYRIIC